MTSTTFLNSYNSITGNTRTVNIGIVPVTFYRTSVYNSRGLYVGSTNTNGYITVGVPNGYSNFTITSIVYTFYRYSQTATATVSGGSGSLSTSGNTVTWTGTATTSVRLDMSRGNNTNSRNVLSGITIYYSYEE